MAPKSVRGASHALALAGGETVVPGIVTAMGRESHARVRHSGTQGHSASSGSPGSRLSEPATAAQPISYAEELALPKTEFAPFRVVSFYKLF